jgi:hypothetical protein
MDGVGKSSSISLQCADAAVDAAESDAGCALAAAGWVAAAPTGVGAVVGGIIAGVACFSAGWNSAEAVDRCTDGDWSSGMAPFSGEDGVEDHRNDPADAPWRSRVELQPLEPQPEGSSHDGSSD